MGVDSGAGPLLTLEPLMDAVRQGLESAGWELSGMQKTTSYEFEGRWAGDASRSAYLFFHRDEVPDWASLDVFLDETSRGLRGNLALVVDGRRLGGLPEPRRVLADLAAVAASRVPPGHRIPITLRYRVPGLEASPDGAETEARFKLHLPSAVIGAGAGAVSELARATAVAFEAILSAPGLGWFVPGHAGPEEGEAR